MLQAYAAAYVERIPPCGYVIGLAKRTATAADTAFRFDEFFAVQHVLASLHAKPWKRLADDVATDDEALLCVPIDARLHASMDKLLEVALADIDRTKHEWTNIFNGVGDDPDAELRCTVAFRGAEGELAIDVFAAVRRTALRKAFGSDDDNRKSRTWTWCLSRLPRTWPSAGCCRTPSLSRAPSHVCGCCPRG